MIPSVTTLSRFFALLGSLAVCGVCAAANVAYLSDNGYGNPISSLQHPVGEHYQGVTYVAYQGLTKTRISPPTSTPRPSGSDPSKLA